jgi:hypothetical protein
MDWMTTIDRRIAGIIAGLKPDGIKPLPTDVASRFTKDGIKHRYPKCCVRFFVGTWSPAIIASSFPETLESVRKYHTLLAQAQVPEGFIPCPQCLRQKIESAGLSDGQLEAAEQAELRRLAEQLAKFEKEDAS